MNQTDAREMEAAVRRANPVVEPATLVDSHLSSAVTLLVEEGRRATPAGRPVFANRVVAFATGFVLAVVAVGLAVVLISDIGSKETPVSDEPVPPAPPSTQLQSTSPPGGVITVEIEDFVGAESQELAGTLMYYNADSPNAYKWEGVAGFAVVADADPFSTSVMFGNVDPEWQEPDTATWPWASGVATVPAGEYSFQLWLGTDHCCYSRWVPADTPGLRWCEMKVKTSGYDQTIRVAGIGDNHRCLTPAEADTGTIHLSIEDWSDLDGHQVLAVVWTKDQSELVGGAFWTTVRDGRFLSLADAVHPVVDPRLPDPEPADPSDWAANDYVWTETAQLAPGTYLVEFSAHPGALLPYGSHIPTAAERGCRVEVRVSEAHTSVVSITKIPKQAFGFCPMPSMKAER